MKDRRVFWTPERRAEQAERIRNRRPWLEAEEGRLMKMRADNIPFAECAKVFGRSAMSCTAKWHQLHQRERIHGRATVDAGPPVKTIFIPEDVLADRDRRMRLKFAPRDLTAMFCGDPLPGASALDRRRE